MDFRRQIVTCLFSMLRLSFETQKVKENYAIFSKKTNHLSIFIECLQRTGQAIQIQIEGKNN